MLCSVIANAIVESSVYSFHQVIGLSLSMLSLMFRFTKVKPRTAAIEKPVSLLDLDSTPSSSSISNIVFSPDVDNQLQDLLDFDNQLMLPVFPIQDKSMEDTHISSSKIDSIDDMILANLMKFEEQSSVNAGEARECSSCLVKRR